VIAAAVATAFMLYYYWFDLAGGFGKLGGTYPSPSPLWIIHPTIEAVSYATLIAYYDSSFTPSATGISGFIGRMGAYSYSIYLLHVFIVFKLPWILLRWFDLTNFYIAITAAAVCYFCMYPIAWLSFRYIEKPFLRFRLRYTHNVASPEHLVVLPPAALA
jgi:rhamnosyltransferase